MLRAILLVASLAGALAVPDAAPGAEKRSLLKSDRPEKTLTGHPGYVYCVAFSPDGGTLAVATGDRLYHLFDQIIWSQVVGNTGVAPVSGYHGEVQLWDVKTGRRTAVLGGHTGYCYTTAFSPDGKWLASGGSDGQLRIWNVKSRKLERRAVYDVKVTSVAFSPRGDLLAAGLDDGRVRLIDFDTWRTVRTLKGAGGSLNSITFSPDGKRLLADCAPGAEDLYVLWRAPDWRVEQIVRRNYRSSVICIAFAEEGRKIATGCFDGAVKLWDPETGEILRTLYKVESRDLYSLAVSQRDVLAAGSGDGTVHLGRLDDGPERAEIIRGSRGDTYVAFSPDGLTLAVGRVDGRTVELWSLKEE